MRFVISVLLAHLLFPRVAQGTERDTNMEVSVAKVIAACVEKGLCGDELAVGLESGKASARYMYGWTKRDAKISVGGASEEAARVQRMMDMTVSIDYLHVEIEVVAVAENGATVLARQKFSRMLRLPDEKERRRITSVTHRETWEKAGDKWVMKGFVEEDQTAKWEDEG